jgi:hypothetical protein
MQIITILSSKATSAPDLAPHAATTFLASEPVPGFIRKVRLSEHGLTVSHGSASVLIPLSEILHLAETAEPALLPAPSSPASSTPN